MPSGSFAANGTTHSGALVTGSTFASPVEKSALRLMGEATSNRFPDVSTYHFTVVPPDSVHCDSRGRTRLSKPQRDRTLTPPTRDVYETSSGAETSLEVPRVSLGGDHEQ